MSAAAATVLQLPTPLVVTPLPPLPSCKALTAFCTLVCQLVAFQVWYRRAEAKARARYARHVGDHREAAALEATRQSLPRVAVEVVSVCALLWAGLAAAYSL